MELVTLQALHVGRPLIGVDQRHDGQVLGNELLSLLVDHEALGRVQLLLSGH